MLLNELPLWREGASGFVLAADVVIFYVGDRYTWRGLGQTCPNGAEIIGTAKVVYELHEGGVYEPVGVCVKKCFGATGIALNCNWTKPDLFEPHQTKIKFGDVAWFEHV